MSENTIISESIRKVGEVRGKDMWVENCTYMPYQAKRGRKPASAAA